MSATDRISFPHAVLGDKQPAAAMVEMCQVELEDADSGGHFTPARKTGSECMCVWTVFGIMISISPLSLELNFFPNGSESSD